MLEKTIQQKILHYCKTKNILAYKMDSTSTVGFPDLTVILPDGEVLFIELKTDTGKLSRMQEYIHQQLTKQKANVYVCRSLEEFYAATARRNPHKS